MNDISLSLITGIEIPVVELQLIIHQPSIKEIAFMGETNFFTAIHYLSLKKESLIEDKTLLQELTNFQVLMKVIEQSDSTDKKTAIITLLSLLFPDYKVSMTPNSILFINTNSQNGEKLKPIMVDKDNFEVLQDIVSKVCCVHSLLSGDQITYNPSGKLAEKIANKIYASRKKIAELNAAKEKGKDGIISRYISILAVGLQQPIQTLTDLTIYQLFDLVERYSLYLDWDIDLRTRLAGGQPNKQAENWMKSIH